MRELTTVRTVSPRRWHPVRLNHYPPANPAPAVLRIPRSSHDPQTPDTECQLRTNSSAPAAGSSWTITLSASRCLNQCGDIPFPPLHIAPSPDCAFRPGFQARIPSGGVVRHFTEVMAAMKRPVMSLWALRTPLAAELSLSGQYDSHIAYLTQKAMSDILF